MPNLMLVRLAIIYDRDSGYIKWQSWTYSDFLRKTSRLVFDSSKMGSAEQEMFNRERRDWRENPCLVRYRTDGGDPDFFCKRGADGKKDRKYKGRGRPLSIEFQMDSGNPSCYHCDEAWLKETAILEFQHDQNYDPANLVITRTSSDGAVSQFEIITMATAGPMRTPGKVDDFACGFPQQVTRKTRR